MYLFSKIYFIYTSRIYVISLSRYSVVTKASILSNYYFPFCQSNRTQENGQFQTFSHKRSRQTLIQLDRFNDFGRHRPESSSFSIPITVFSAIIASNSANQIKPRKMVNSKLLSQKIKTNYDST